MAKAKDSEEKIEEEPTPIQSEPKKKAVDPADFDDQTDYLKATK